MLAVFGSCQNDEATLPVMSSLPVNSITAITATAGGFITGDGGAKVTERGVVWDIEPSPEISLVTRTLDGTGIGSYSSFLTSLSPGTVYYVRAYATNTAGTVYGNELSFETAKLTASITTSPAIDITVSGATSGGTVLTDGGTAVTARGICWSLSSNPTISLVTKTTDGIGTGTFSSTMTALLPGRQYFVRAYATNDAGTAYGNEVNFSTTASLPVLATTALSNITPSDAISGGMISSDGGTITAHGICWSTSTNPTIDLSTKTIDGNGTGTTFTSNLTGLSPSTKYYVRSYATNAAGTGYGNELSFTTAAVQIPTLTTKAVTDITLLSAISGGTISSNGGAAVTARGICWSTNTNPTIGLATKTTDGIGTGTFTSNLAGLSQNTQYYVRSYATNAAGTAYGNEVSFTTATAQLPTLATRSVADITIFSATSGGTISSDGGAAVTARGICWSTSANPTVGLATKTTDGNGTGTFTSNLAGLAQNTQYYVRSYATNAAGTAYGNELTFTTFGVQIPAVTTAAVSSIASLTATSGGQNDSGGATITARGICWSTSPNPTIALSTKTVEAGNIGTFISFLAGLSANTQYYVRAYATNSAGTGYGNEVSFTTNP